MEEQNQEDIIEKFKKCCDKHKELKQYVYCSENNKSYLIENLLNKFNERKYYTN